MSRPDLDLCEQRYVRTAIRYLAVRLGGMTVVANALRCEYDSLYRIIRGTRGVTASVAFRVARLADVSIDKLLTGRAVPQGTCPHCGRTPDFADVEETIVEDV